MAKEDEQGIEVVIHSLDTLSTECTFNVPLLRTGSSYSVENLERYHTHIYNAQETDLLHGFLVQLSQDSDKDYTAIKVMPEKVLKIFHHPSGTTFKTGIKLVAAFKRLRYQDPNIIIWDPGS